MTIDEIRTRKLEEDGAEAAKKPKTARAGASTTKKGLASAKKKFGAKGKDVEVMIKVKDEEGKIVEFETDE